MNKKILEEESNIDEDGMGNPVIKQRKAIRDISAEADHGKNGEMENSTYIGFV